MTRRPPRSPLFPYTTLSRSHGGGDLDPAAEVDRPDHGLHGVGEDGRLVAPPGALLATTELDVLAEADRAARSEEHTSELQSRQYLVCRLLLEKKKTTQTSTI